MNMRSGQHIHITHTDYLSGPIVYVFRRWIIPNFL